MNIIKYPAKEDWKEIVKRPHLDLSQLNTTVEAVLGDVKNHGDAAVKRYEEKFDHAHLDHLAVTEEEIKEAEQLVSSELRHSIELAHHRSLYPGRYCTFILNCFDASHSCKNCRMQRYCSMLTS